MTEPERHDIFSSMNNPLFRPPAEADSLILQVDQGCPHNRCTFCGMYRHVTYRRLPMDEIADLISAEAAAYPAEQRIFLADADVISRPFDELAAILDLLAACFPRLARVNSYANGNSILKKSSAELLHLKKMKLHTLYMGLESGDDKILNRCRKGETAGRMVNAAAAAQAAGLRMSVMVLLGLGGAEASLEHAANTAAALNRMQPRILSALRVIPVPGTELFRESEKLQFRQLTEWQAADELRNMIRSLDLKNTVFRANHISNVIPIEARFPRDREKLLSELDAILNSDLLDRFSPGPAPLSL